MMNQIALPATRASDTSEQQQPPPMTGPASSPLILPPLVAIKMTVTSVTSPQMRFHDVGSNRSTGEKLVTPSHFHRKRGNPPDDLSCLANRL
jgi:hypothetical protein